MTELFELTEAQQGILVESMASTDSTTYFMQACYEFPSRLDAGDVHAALDGLQEMHPAIGICLDVDEESGAVSQALVPRDVCERLEACRLDQSRANGSDLFTEFLERDRARGVDLLGGALWRATLVDFADVSTLVISYHHVILDGWSAALLQDHLLALLNHDLVEGKDRFREIAARGWAASTSGSTSTELEEWKEQLEGCQRGHLPESIDLNDCTVSESGDLMEGSSKAIEWVASEARSTVSSVCQVVHGIAIAALTGDWNGHATGVVTSGRDLWPVDLSETVGCFMRTIPIGFRPREEATVGEASHALLDAVLEGMIRPLPQLDDVLTPRDTGAFEDVFIFENYPANFDRMKSMGVRRWSVDRNAYPLVAFYWRSSRGLSYDIQTSGSTSSGVASDYVAIVKRLAKLLETGMRELREVSLAEMVAEACEACCDISNDGEQWGLPSLDAVIQARASIPSDRGIILDGERIAWSQVIRRSVRLRAALNLPTGSIIAVCLGNPQWAVMCVVACVVNGWVWVPVDPTLPVERKRFIVDDSGAQVIVADGEGPFATGDGPTVIQWSDIDDQDQTGQADVQTFLVDPATPAYTIYTSGSTGKPKGVLVSRKNLDGYASGMQELFKLPSSSSVLLNHSLSFDNSIWEIMLAFYAGADLVTVRDRRDFYEVLRAMVSQRVKVLSVTPSQLGVLLEVVEYEPDLREAFSNLEILFVGSEEVPPGIIVKAINFLPSRVRVFNEYGPTETTIVSSLHEVFWSPNREPLGEFVPIGKPTVGNIFLVADKDGYPNARGSVGELWIGGDAVSDGYVGRPELTAMKFTLPPWDVRGRRWYRTGDSVKRLPDGAFVFLGRVDDQVKVRGFRIELGEVERALRTVLSGAECAVVAPFDASTATSKLVAFYTDDSSTQQSEIRRALEELLPSYGVPTKFFRMKSLPLNSSGKIDRGELRNLAVRNGGDASAEVDTPPPGPQDGFMAPSGKTDVAANGSIAGNASRPAEDKNITEVVRAIERVLGRVADLRLSFKSNGGDSLAAMRVRNILAFRGTDLTSAELLADVPLSRLRPQSSMVPAAASGPADAPISATQRGLAAATAMNADGSTYIDHLLLECSSPISIDRLTRAVDEVAERHGILRASFDLKNQVWRGEKRVTAAISQGSVDGISSWSSVVRDWKAGELSPRMIELRLQQMRESSRLSVVWHHAALDGTGIDLLLSDLLSVLDGHRPSTWDAPSYDFISAMGSLASRDPVREGSSPRVLSRGGPSGDFRQWRMRRTFSLPGLQEVGSVGPTALICAALVGGVRQSAGVASAAAVQHGRDLPASERVAGSYASLVALPVWDEGQELEKILALYEHTLSASEPGAARVDDSRTAGLSVVIAVNDEPRAWPVGWSEIDVFDGSPADVLFNVFKNGEGWDVNVYADERLNLERLETQAPELVLGREPAGNAEVLHVIADVLKRPDLTHAELESSLIQLGGDSLSAVLLSRRLGTLGIPVSITDLLGVGSVRGTLRGGRETKVLADPGPTTVSRSQAGMLHGFLTTGGDLAYVQAVALEIDQAFASSVPMAWQRAVIAHPEIAHGFSYDAAWPARTPGNEEDLARISRLIRPSDSSPERLIAELRGSVKLSSGSGACAGFIENPECNWFVLAYFHALLDGEQFADVLSTFVEGLSASEDGPRTAPADLSIRRITSPERETIGSVLRGAALQRIEQRAKRENTTIAATLLADFVQSLWVELGPEEGLKIEVPRVSHLAEVIGETPLVVAATQDGTREQALQVAQACLHATELPSAAGVDPAVTVSTTLLYTFDRGSTIQDEIAQQHGIRQMLAFEDPGQSDALDVDFDPGVMLRVTANIRKNSRFHTFFRQWVGGRPETSRSMGPGVGRSDLAEVERIVEKCLVELGCIVHAPGQTLAEMGLDSLRVFALRRSLMDEFECELTIADLGPNRTIEMIGEAITSGSNALSAEPVVCEPRQLGSVELSERERAHLTRFERFGADLSIVPLWIPQGNSPEQTESMLERFWTDHSWLGKTIVGSRWRPGPDLPRVLMLNTFGAGSWEDLAANFSTERALAIVVRVERLGLTFLVLDHILYDQDVLNQLEADFLALREGASTAASMLAVDPELWLRDHISGTSSRTSVETLDWDRIEFTCNPDRLYKRLCGYLRRWCQEHGKVSLLVLKDRRSENYVRGPGGDWHSLEWWVFDANIGQLIRADRNEPDAIEEAPDVHLTIIENDPRLPDIRLVHSVPNSVSSTADGACSVDVEVLLSSNAAAVKIDSCAAFLS